MFRSLRAVALAAIAILTLSVGALLSAGAAQAAPQAKGDAFPAGNTLTVSVVDGPAKANCMATIKWTVDGTTSTRTTALNLDSTGSGTTTFKGLENTVYRADAQCPGVKDISGLPVNVRVNDVVPPNLCVQIVHDIATAFGLRGNQLAVVMGIARQFCP